MFKNIQFFSQSEISQINGSQNTIVISIANSKSPNANIKPDFKDSLFLNFDFTDQLSYHSVRFSGHHAQSIIDFVQKYQNDDTVNNIYINCIQGQSRSAAVAHYLSLLYNIPLSKSTEDMLFWIYECLEMENPTGHLDF